MPGDTSWFTSSKELVNKLTEQPDLKFYKSDTIKSAIVVNPSVKYQPFEGFGSSLEETTVFNLSQMAVDKRDDLLEKIVSPDKGIGFNMMRICIGSSDFTSRKFYTYDETVNNEEDLSLSHFSIQKDIDYNIINVLQKAIQINPEIRFVASPWSPPSWMKTSKNIIGGEFLPKYIEVYAKYLTKFLIAYKEKGIPVFAITLQNEPLFAPEDYPGCVLSSKQAQNLAIALKKELVKNKLDTKILIYDHNFGEALQYALPILADSTANKAIDGTAFHGYAPPVANATTIHSQFPDKAIYFTERSYWGVNGVSDIIDIFRSWSRTYIGWVTMLNSEIGPEQWSGVPGPTMIIKDAKNKDNYWLTGEYYLMGQFSKFIKLGAYRIDSNVVNKSLNNVAFMNPDGSIVLIVSNISSEKMGVSVKVGEEFFSTSIPGKTVVTYVF
jgi:glucosylceramidase